MRRRPKKVDVQLCLAGSAFPFPMSLMAGPVQAAGQKSGRVALPDWLLRGVWVQMRSEINAFGWLLTEMQPVLKAIGWLIIETQTVLNAVGWLITETQPMLNAIGWLVKTTRLEV